MRGLVCLTLVCLVPFRLTAGEDTTPGDAKRVASLAFKYVQRHQNDDGSYGAKESPLIVSQTALVVHALAASSWSYREEDGPFLLKAGAFLRAAQNEDGSFGKSRAKAAETILAVRALLALGKESDNERIDKGIAFIKQNTKPLANDDLDGTHLEKIVGRTTTLLGEGANRATWKEPTAGASLLVLACASLQGTEQALATLSARCKLSMAISWAVANPSLPVSLELLQSAVRDLKTMQQTKDDQADDYSAIPPERNDNLDGNSVVSTALAGSVADLVRSNYKMIQKKLAAEKK